MECGGQFADYSRSDKLRHHFSELGDRFQNVRLRATRWRACQLAFPTAKHDLEIPPLTVSWWKLQSANLQDEFGKLAPRVTKHQEAHSLGGLEGPNVTNEVRQTAWFCTALEELAQMCGAFLAATPTAAASPPAGCASAPLSAGAPHVKITVQVGDSLNFCDALLTASASPTSAAERAPSSAAGASGAMFEPLAFQQGSLQPLHLRADEFDYPPEFDVISTSNLSEHLGVRVEGRKSRGTQLGWRAICGLLVRSPPALDALGMVRVFPYLSCPVLTGFPTHLSVFTFAGIINLLVATAPLLKTVPHAALLTSLMSSLQNLHRYKDMASFQDKLLCMSPQAAGILLGEWGIKQCIVYMVIY